MRVASATLPTARMYAPVRMWTPYFLEVVRTSWKARVMIFSRCWLTCASSQKNAWSDCTHSKYETVTPPAFARMSGIRKTPFLYSRSEEHTSELQSHSDLVCRLLLE